MPGHDPLPAHQCYPCKTRNNNDQDDRSTLPRIDAAGRLVENEHKQYTAEHDKQSTDVVELLETGILRGVEIAWPDKEEGNRRHKGTRATTVKLSVIGGSCLRGTETAHLIQNAHRQDA